MRRRALGDSPVQKKSGNAPLSPLPFLRQQSPKRPQTSVFRNTGNAQVISPTRFKPTTAMSQKPTSGNATLDSFLRMYKKVEWVVKPMVDKTKIEALMKKEPETEVPSFIREFVLDKTADDCALKIQRAWRAYLEKKQWKCVFNKRIWNRGDVLRRIFFGWMAYASKNMRLVEKYYEKNYQLYEQKPWLSKKYVPMPFTVFYLTGRFFMPASYNVRLFYYISRLFLRATGRYVLKRWHSMAHSMRESRKNARCVKFTTQKRLRLGEIYYCFVMWHRYSKWKKMSSQRPDCFKLDCSEIIINWHVLEQTLNMRKARLKRAIAHSDTRIVRKAQSAIYQKYIKSKQIADDMESSLQFYHHHIQHKGHMAWMRYMALERHRLHATLRIMRAWYQVFYQDVRLKKFHKIVHERHLAIQNSRYLKRWQAGARLERLEVIDKALKIQKNPVIPYMVAFCWTGRDEMVTFIRIWREWIAYARRRRMWKMFVGRFHNEDKAREEKKRVVFALRRAGQTKVLHRLAVTNAHIIQQLTPYTIEPMLSMMDEAKRKNVTKEDWKFLTEMRSDKKFTREALNRAIYVFLHKKMNFENCAINSSEEMEDVKEETGKGTWNDLWNQIHSNAAHLRRMIRIKLQRDATILASIVCHSRAVSYQENHQSFTLAKDDTVAFEFAENQTYTPQLEFTPGSEQILKKLIASNNGDPRHLPRNYREEFFAAIDEFYAHFHKPLPVNDTDLMSGPIMTPSTNNTTTTTGPTGPAVQQPRAGHIVPYKPPSRISSAPIDPSLKQTKALNDLSREKSSSMQDRTLARFQISSLRSFVSPNPAESVECLGRFFGTMCDITLDLSTMLSHKDYSVVARDLDQIMHHKLKRNIASFVAQMCDYNTSTGVPLAINTPPHVDTCVAVVLTVFNALKGTKLMQYCDSIPFFEMVDLDQPELVNLRHIIFVKILEKVPRVAKEYRRMGIKNVHSIQRIDMFDELTLQDSYVAVLLLPMIMRIDHIKDFLKEEIKIDQAVSAQGVLENESSFALMQWSQSML